MWIVGVRKICLITWQEWVLWFTFSIIWGFAITNHGKNQVYPDVEIEREELIKLVKSIKNLYPDMDDWIVSVNVCLYIKLLEYVFVGCNASILKSTLMVKTIRIWTNLVDINTPEIPYSVTYTSITITITSITSTTTTTPSWLPSTSVQ